MWHIISTSDSFSSAWKLDDTSRPPVDLHGHHIISEITNLCMNFIISSSFLQWPSQNMSNGAKKLKFKISLIFHKKDYSMSNLEQSKVQGNLKRQIQHTLDPGLFSSSLVMMVQPLLWAWKGVRCKKPLDNYIIDVHLKSYLDTMDRTFHPNTSNGG